MTVYGPQTTDKDVTYGWEVLTANHRHYNQAVDQAKAAMQEAWLRYDNAVDGEAKYEVLKSLRAEANEAEQAYFKAWENWQEELATRLRELDKKECAICNPPDGPTCQTCLTRYHADSIPDQCYGNAK